MALNGAALVEIEAGELDAAQPLLIEAYPVALGTRDMPIVAMVGVSVAALAHRRGDRPRERRDPRRRRTAAGHRGSDAS